MDGVEGQGKFAAQMREAPVQTSDPDGNPRPEVTSGNELWSHSKASNNLGNNLFDQLN